jgi:hypothetical protein
MRTFREYSLHRDLLEFDVEGGIPSEDEQKKFGKNDAARERLLELAKIAIKKFPEETLSFVKTLQDDEIQEKVKNIENEGGLRSMQLQKPVDDQSNDVVAPNSPDSAGGLEGE